MARLNMLRLIVSSCIEYYIAECCLVLCWPVLPMLISPHIGLYHRRPFPERRYRVRIERALHLGLTGYLLFLIGPSSTQNKLFEPCSAKEAEGCYQYEDCCCEHSYSNFESCYVLGLCVDVDSRCCSPVASSVLSIIILRICFISICCVLLSPVSSLIDLDKVCAVTICSLV